MRVFCRWVEREVTAFLDQELPSWRWRLVSHHLKRCEHCRFVAAETARVIEAQRIAFCDAAEEFSVPVSTNLDSLWKKLEDEVFADPVPLGLRVGWPIKRIGYAIGVALFLVAAGYAGRDFDVVERAMMAIGVVDPPPEVVQSAEFFCNYPVIEELDVLEHWDRLSQGLPVSATPENGHS